MRIQGLGRRGDCRRGRGGKGSLAARITTIDTLPHTPSRKRENAGGGGGIMRAASKHGNSSTESTADKQHGWYRQTNNIGAQKGRPTNNMGGNGKTITWVGGNRPGASRKQQQQQKMSYRSKNCGTNAIIHQQYFCCSIVELFTQSQASPPHYDREDKGFAPPTTTRLGRPSNKTG